MLSKVKSHSSKIETCKSKFQSQLLPPMADEPSTTDSPLPPPVFLEVSCKLSGKMSRFAPGTKAGFAVSLINRKSGFGNPLIAYIEAVKEGDEPISFGPDAVLVDYGSDWKLQTVSEADYEGDKKGVRFQRIPTPIPTARTSEDTQLMNSSLKPKDSISLAYVGRILVAFIMMFVFGAIFTLSLENLPRLIFFINSYMYN